MRDRKRRLLIPGAILLLLAVLLMGALAVRHYRHRSSGEIVFPSLPETPESDVWYRVDTEGTVSADGTGWHGMFRLGTEDRLVVYFYGGGIALDDYTTARPYSLKSDGFYYDTEAKLRDYQATWGFGNLEEYTPFRNWSIIAIPYTTGDLHIGQGIYPCTLVNGSFRTVRFRGYDNYEILMNQVRDLVGDPEAILITGTSAGGFGASLLAEDVETWFPKTDNVTVCIDSALLLKEDWPETARDLWQAPAEIANRLHSDNIVLDALTSLHQNAPETKILYTCSLRDAELTRFQSYVDTGTGVQTREAGDVFQRNLTDMVSAIQGMDPEAGFYIWNAIPYSQEEGETLTRHTVLVSNYAREPLAGDKVFLDWIMDAVEGDVRSWGMDLLEPQNAA